MFLLYGTFEAVDFSGISDECSERTGKMEGAKNFSDGNGGCSSGLRYNEGNDRRHLNVQTQL
jgi:hypothetical protein